jgi:hypothetical protein
MPAEAITASVHIDAPPEQVYEYFTRPEAIISWMGEYALLEAEPGGQFVLDIKGAPVGHVAQDPERLSRCVTIAGHGYSARSAVLSLILRQRNCRRRRTEGSLWVP